MVQKVSNTPFSPLTYTYGLGTHQYIPSLSHQHIMIVVKSPNTPLSQSTHSGGLKSPQYIVALAPQHILMV